MVLARLAKQERDGLIACSFLVDINDRRRDQILIKVDYTLKKNFAHIVLSFLFVQNAFNPIFPFDFRLLVKLPLILTLNYLCLHNGFLGQNSTK